MGCIRHEREEPEAGDVRSKQYRGHGLPFEELIQEGNIGLLNHKEVGFRPAATTSSPTAVCSEVEPTVP